MILNKIFSWNKLSLLGLSLILLNTACTDSFESTNTNGHEATEDMMSHDNLKTGAFFSQLQRNIVLFKDGSNLDSDYQIAQGLSGDIFSGFIAPTITAYSGKHNGSYYFVNNWIEKVFKSGFSSVMPAWQSIVEIADKQELPEVSALATVMKIEAMHRVADAYGPIPYCNFGSGSLKNTYDGLDDVYKSFFTELDEAIDVLTEFVNGNPNATILEKYDLVYGGDAKKWVKFANTLRLRLAVRIAYVSPGLAQTEAEKSIKNIIGVITEVNDRAALQHSSNLVYYHPLYEIASNFNAGEARMGASMDAYMNGYKDPRLAAYFKPATSGGYHGVRLGIQTSTWDKYAGSNISTLNMDQSTTQIVWMTAAESYFLRAEGVLRKWNMNGTAKDFYEQGISISFEENGAKGADTYIADKVSTPIPFKDNAEGSDYHADAPSTVTIAWDEQGTFEKNMEQIITQKWIAIYPDGPEGWAEFRRTGYPKLFPVVRNNSNGTVDQTIQVRRIPYPQSEYDNNNEGVQSGIAKLNGQDNGGTKLWWDKK